MEASQIDTIVARGTARGSGAIGILRVSGPGTRRICSALFSPKYSSLKTVFSDRRLHLGVFSIQAGDEVDEGLLLFNKGPRSYTGEDLAEFHHHGGDFLLETMLQACVTAGARLARPGEFTRRAYVNGKLDLAQAEAVMALIDARSAVGLKAAKRMLAGDLSKKLSGLKRSLLDVARWLELSIDFPEEDLPEAEPEDILNHLTICLNKINELVRGSLIGDVLRRGIYVTLYGIPNSGKSTLLNAICGQQRALVSDIPGTTRDIVQVQANIGNFYVTFQDTAGLRPTSDVIEKMGVEATEQSLQIADITLLVVDASKPPASGVASELERATILVLNKKDLGLHPEIHKLMGISQVPCVVVSANSGDGIPELFEHLSEELLRLSAHGPPPLMVNHVQQTLLVEGLACIKEACNALELGLSYEAPALHVSSALIKLNSVVGGEADEELLDEIFASFCLGK